MPCDMFVSFLDVSGGMNAGNKRCLDPKCYAKTYSARAAANQDKPNDPNEPRCSWHGEYFREAFFETRLPEVVLDLPNDAAPVLRLAVLSLLELNSEARTAFGKIYDSDGMEVSGQAPGWHCVGYGTPALWKFLEQKSPADLLDMLKWISNYCLMEKRTTFPSVRRLVADHLGISLDREWRITEEYLAKKTTSEIHGIAKKFNLFTDGKAEAYLTGTLGKKSGRFDSCKKSELVQLILKSGIELAGVVPDEILKEDSIVAI